MSVVIPDRSDKKAFAEYAASVMRGWAEGKKVQYKNNITGEWVDHVNDPSWIWSTISYRLAPEAPAVEPFTFENAPNTLKVRRKSDGKPGIAELYPDGYSVFYALTGDGTDDASFTKFAEDYEQLDGTPCGTVKVSEWPKWFTWTSGDGSHVWRMDSEVVGDLFIGGEFYTKTCRTATDLASDPSGEYKQITPAEAEALIQKARAK